MDLKPSVAVSITGLEFGYPAASRPLFMGLDLVIATGRRFGLFGPNGAGKTSLMGLMTGLLPFRRGRIEVAGLTVRDKAVRKQIGLVPQELSFYEELTPIENLAFFGAWYGLSPAETKTRTRDLLAVLLLEEFAGQRASQLSGGMKRKLNLAIGVIHRPAVLFLDEPTVGVDVHTRKELIRYLIGLNENGTTLVYTSHQLDEAEALCDRVALIDGGRIVACDDLPALLAMHEQKGLEGLFLQLTGKTFNTE
jgi:ABC-2 type transport system ATP-binding protein